MFNLFKNRNNKEYISCEWLEYGMVCMDNGLDNCDLFPNPQKYYAPVSKVKNNKYNFKEFFLIKEKMRKQRRKGIIFDRCLGCPELRLNNWDYHKKIKRIVLACHTRCNSDCIYCYTHKFKNFYNNKPDIKIKDFIKKAINKRIIDKNISINFCGGEPTLNEEFVDILNMILNIENAKIKIYSSGIKYSQAIEDALKQDKVEVIISPDSGNQELYKKIKGVDKFNDVWNNITKYAAAQKNIKTNVVAKYIIIKNINDNEKNIKEFFEKVFEADLKMVKFEVDFNYCSILYNSKEKIKEVFELIHFMENYAKTRDINYYYGGNLSCLIANNKELFEHKQNN